MEKKREALFSDISRDFVILISPSFLSNTQIMLSWGLFINKLFILTCLLYKCPPHPRKTKPDYNLYKRFCWVSLLQTTSFAIG